MVYIRLVVVYILLVVVYIMIVGCGIYPIGCSIYAVDCMHSVGCSVYSVGCGIYFVGCMHYAGCRYSIGCTHPVCIHACPCRLFMENKFGCIVRALHGKRVKALVAELLNTIPIDLYASLQLRVERCRGTIKSCLLPAAAGELHDPSPRTQALVGGDTMSLLGKGQSAPTPALAELESIHSWALAEDNYAL